MTTAVECLALADELEAAPEGSRELSDSVLLACGWGHTTAISFDGRNEWGSPGGVSIFSEGSQPNPTRNLADWKRWCVPEGFTSVKIEWHGPTVFINQPKLAPQLGKAWVEIYGKWIWDKMNYGIKVSYVATPELAACAASLRAMAEMMEDKGSE